MKNRKHYIAPRQEADPVGLCGPLLVIAPVSHTDEHIDVPDVPIVDEDPNAVSQRDNQDIWDNGLW